MKYLQDQTIFGDNDCSEDASLSSAALEQQLERIESDLRALPADQLTPDRLSLETERGYTLLALERYDQAWDAARGTLDRSIEAEAWQQAVEACDILFQCDQPESIQALAHGIWLGTSFPIDPELSVAMLQHLIDETPDRSDGAAVAAATANYLVDLRAEGETRDNLLFFSNQLLGQVARRHSQVEEQEIFDFWVQQLELDQPDKFIPRLGKVLDVLTEERWWFDRDQIRNKIPA